MALKKEKAIFNHKQVFNLKQVFQKYLFPITIVSSILISGSIGYTTSQIAVSKNVGDQTEINSMKKQVNEARNNSLKVIETEIPRIISDLDNYNQDIKFLLDNVEWLAGNLAPIRDGIGKLDTVNKVVQGVDTIVDFPIIDKLSTKLDFTQTQFDEIDSILLGLEKLKVIQQEMNDSHLKLSSLYEEYQKEKSIEQLLQIEQVLNSSLIFQIEDLRNTTIEVHKVFELSSSILITANKTKSLSNSIKEKAENTLNKIQFWKENGGSSENEAKKESSEKDLEASIKKIQKLPNELTQRSKSSITSISNVQKELQTIKIAQMISNE